VASRALAVGVPVVVVAGEVELGRRETVSAGIEAAYAVDERLRGGRAGPAPGGTADGDPAAALADRSARVARTWSRRP
jgi:glycerate kinase